MPTYSSNSPYFLQYLASTFTRDEIINSPEYCYLLEDPDIKDDVEIAFLYQDAKTGGYEEKKEFIQYLLCNGPELDAHTILYYRNIILNNNELYNIYRYEFSYNTAEIQMNLRESIYKKATSRSGKKSCFDDPGAYLGPFNVTAAVGINVTEWQNPRNVYAKLVKEKRRDIKKPSTDVSPQNLIVEERKTKNLTPEAKKASQILNVAASAVAAQNINKNDPGVNEIEESSGDSEAIDTAKNLEDGLQLTLISTAGDMYRCYNFSKNYSDFNPNTNKKMPMSSTFSYKYPFGLRKTNIMQQSPAYMGPNGMMNALGTERVYYDETDKAYLCMFEPEGSFIIKKELGNTSEKPVSYTNLAENDTGRRAGNGFSGIKICPADWSSSIEGTDNFIVGVFIDLNTAAESIRLAFSNSVATDEDYKKMINSNLIWCKIKISLGTSAGADGSISHMATIIYAPLVGPSSAISNDKLFKIGIDPMLFLTNTDLAKKYVISPSGDDNITLSSTKKIKSDSTIDGYNMKLLKEVEDHKTFEVKSDIKNKVASIRFYIPSNFRSNVENLFPNLYKKSAYEAKATKNGVYLEEDIFNVGNKDKTFIEYKQSLFCPQVPEYNTRLPHDAKWVTGMDCGIIDRNKAISYITSKSSFKQRKLSQAEVTQIVDMFIKYGEENRVNPALAVAIFIHETDFGSSVKFRTQNNPGGLKKSETEFHSFNNREQGISHMCQRLASSNYSGKSFRDVGLTYCPVCDENGNPHVDNSGGLNDHWLPNVLMYMTAINR